MISIIYFYHMEIFSLHPEYNFYLNETVEAMLFIVWVSKKTQNALFVLAVLDICKRSRLTKAKQAKTEDQIGKQFKSDFEILESELKTWAGPFW